MTHQAAHFPPRGLIKVLNIPCNVSTSALVTPLYNNIEDYLFHLNH